MTENRRKSVADAAARRVCRRRREKEERRLGRPRGTSARSRSARAFARQLFEYDGLGDAARARRKRKRRPRQNVVAARGGFAKRVGRRARVRRRRRAVGRVGGRGASARVAAYDADFEMYGALGSRAKSPPRREPPRDGGGRRRRRHVFFAASLRRRRLPNRRLARGQTRHLPRVDPVTMYDEDDLTQSVFVLASKHEGDKNTFVSLLDRRRGRRRPRRRLGARVAEECAARIGDVRGDARSARRARGERVRGVLGTLRGGAGGRGSSTSLIRIIPATTNAARERNCENALLLQAPPPRQRSMAAIRLFGVHTRGDVPSPPRKDVSGRAISRVVRVARARPARALARPCARRAPRPRDLLPFSQSQKSARLDCLPIPANKHRRAAHAKKPRRPPLFFAADQVLANLAVRADLLAEVGDDLSCASRNVGTEERERGGQTRSGRA